MNVHIVNNIKKPLNNRSGFTFIEILVTLSIFALIALITLTTFPAFKQNVDLDSFTSDIVGALTRAQTQTLAGSGGVERGVHIEEFQIVIFEGATYSASAPSNIVIIAPSTVHISSHSLEGGGDDIIFNKITGASDEYGAIIVSLIADPSKTKTITVEKTGVIGAQGP